MSYVKLKAKTALVNDHVLVTEDILEIALGIEPGRIGPLARTAFLALFFTFRHTPLISACSIFSSVGKLSVAVFSHNGLGAIRLVPLSSIGAYPTGVPIFDSSMLAANWISIDPVKFELSTAGDSPGADA